MLRWCSTPCALLLFAVGSAVPVTHYDPASLRITVATNVFESSENITSGISVDGEPATGSMLSAVKFMQKFGYFPKGDETADFLFSSSALESALKEVQKFGAIPETGILDNATIQLMQTPRCGVPDVTNPLFGRQKRYILGPGGWNKRHITYTVANWSPQLKSLENVKKELRRAFDAWSGYSNLRFVETESNSADIIIYFASYDHYDGYPFDGQGGILAHAYYPYEFGHYGGDIHFDESEQWAMNPNDEFSGLDFFSVAVHEIGHSLGLAHSPQQDSVMFPYYKGYDDYFALGYDDILAMWELYIRRKLEEEGEEATTDPLVPSSTEGSVQNDAPTSEDDVRYDGDYETVDDHKRRVSGGTERLPPLPTMSPPGEEDEYEKERKKWEEEYKRRVEEDKKREEEERKRRQEAEEQRKEEELRRIKEEEERRKREEERIRIEEEKQRREYEEAIERWREQVRQKEEEDRRNKNEGERGIPSDDLQETPPSLCEGNFDAISVLRGEIVVFKGQYLWRFSGPGRMVSGHFPSPVRSVFPALPHFLTKLDAVYERFNDSKMIFFSGKYFYALEGTEVDEAMPYPITLFGVSDAVTELEAAFNWPKNSKTYIFWRNLYWRYDEQEGRIDSYFPRDIGKWNGIPDSLDAVFTSTDGSSYFVKGKEIWQYDDYNVRPTGGYPQDVTKWFGC